MGTRQDDSQRRLAPPGGIVKINVDRDVALIGVEVQWQPYAVIAVEII